MIGEIVVELEKGVFIGFVFAKGVVVIESSIVGPVACYYYQINNKFLLRHFFVDCKNAKFHFISFFENFQNHTEIL